MSSQSTYLLLCVHVPNNTILTVESPQVPATDLAHDVIGVIAIDEVIVVGYAKSFGDEQSLPHRPPADEIVDLPPILLMER